MNEEELEREVLRIMLRAHQQGGEVKQALGVGPSWFQQAPPAKRDSPKSTWRGES